MLMNDGLYILIAFCAGWLIAQSTKFIIAVVSGKGKNNFKDALKHFFKSGGMPSGHTASFVAATITIGFLNGFNSSIFALSAAMTAIIVYDATHVRYAVGEQGKLLNEIAKKDGIRTTKPIALVEGHTIPQAIVGGLIGIAIAFAIKFIFNL